MEDSKTKIKNKHLFEASIELENMWINLLAQSLGINTLFSEAVDTMKPCTFSTIVDNIGGNILAQPVLAKALMFNYITKSVPEIYEMNVENGISVDKVYLFRNWKWDPDAQLPVKWFSYLKGKTHDFPLEEWTKLHDMVMTRCLTTNIRDMFFHFQHMTQYGVFLTGLYEAGNIPIEMLRNDQ